VEITQRDFRRIDTDRAVAAALRKRGAEVAIDDFGTGAPTSQVVGHVMATARTLDLKRIAAGAGSEAPAAFPRAHGVHDAQGRLFGAATPFADVAPMAAGARASAAA
jgi:sensor c-di-GMP phosphodiesterase-like protein